MGGIRFQYYPLDDKGGKGTSKSATGDGDTDGFDFVSNTADGDEAGLTDLVLREETTSAAGVYIDPDMLVPSYQTGGSGGWDVNDPTTHPDDWLG